MFFYHVYTSLIHSHGVGRGTKSLPKKSCDTKVKPYSAVLVLAWVTAYFLFLISNMVPLIRAPNELIAIIEERTTERSKRKLQSGH